MRGMRRATHGLLGMVAAILAGGGCGGPLNEEVGLRGASLPGLASAAEATELDGRPSLTGSFDRTAWPAVAVALPRRQVANHPAFAWFFCGRRESGPWDPAYPDATTALVDETDAGADLADAATELVLTAGTIVAVPVAAAGSGPWAVDRSPSLPYDRLPAR
jgi:hypothetical protein